MFYNIVFQQGAQIIPMNLCKSHINVIGLCKSRNTRLRFRKFCFTSVRGDICVHV